MTIKNKIDKELQNLHLSKEPQEPIFIEEGVLLSVNKIVSDAIAVPEGDYVIWAIDSKSDMCTLMPTAEDRFNTIEVIRPTLQGFYNPEVHKKIVYNSDNSIINENDNS